MDAGQAVVGYVQRRIGFYDQALETSGIKGTVDFTKDAGLNTLLLASWGKVLEPFLEEPERLMDALQVTEAERGLLEKVYADTAFTAQKIVRMGPVDCLQVKRSDGIVLNLIVECALHQTDLLQELEPYDRGPAAMNRMCSPLDEHIGQWGLPSVTHKTATYMNEGRVYLFGHKHDPHYAKLCVKAPGLG